jgi:hypothetical protein
LTQAHWAVICYLRRHHLRGGTLPWDMSASGRVLPIDRVRPQADVAGSPVNGSLAQAPDVGRVGAAPDTRFLGGGVKIFGVAGARCPERQPAALVGQKGACLPWVETRKDLGFGLATTHASVCRGLLFPVSPVFLLTGWQVKEALK